MLTDSQRAVFDYLRECVDNSLPPTVREICQNTGLRSTSSVHLILNKLEDMGFIERGKGSSRAIHIVGMQNAKQVPLLGTVTAGAPITAVEEIEGYIPFTPAGGNAYKDYFALRVRGDSMIDAAILEDDIVICEKTSAVDEGDIVVALIDDEEATVKRFYREGYGFRFEAENEFYDPIYVSEALILGKVVAVVRSYE